MPLHDHFRPPIWNKASWEGFHGMWPATMVQQLVKILPEQYTAEPRVHLGSNYEIDVCAFESDEFSKARSRNAGSSDASAVQTWAPPEPTLTVELNPMEFYEYEVLIFDQERNRQLVAAIEIVSPANKDRPETRQAFVTKCAALLQNGVCVSIVDLVTTRNFNLYCELLNVFCQSDPAFAEAPPATYAVTCRGRQDRQRPGFETWAYPLVVGQPLPVLPVWLEDDHAISLDLEASYLETCRALRLL
ncbi:MAG: DUF4058 family protein [Planctomycetaceae bacterium]|nr:DUF4058 family protein [Planctomycetaceae bacterium]